MANLVQVVDTRKSKKNLPMKIYGLTFKGALRHLTGFRLSLPARISDTGETTDNFKKRLIQEYSEYYRQIEGLSRLLQFYGKYLGYSVFQQVTWLAENYGVVFYDLILENARTTLKTGVPPFFSHFSRQQIVEKHELKERIRLAKKHPFLRKMNLFTEDGKVRRETEIDLVSEAKDKLKQVRIDITWSHKSENEFLKESFTYALFEKLGFMNQKGKEKNEVLLQLAIDLVNKKKEQVITPLERVVSNFSGVKCES